VFASSFNYNQGDTMLPDSYLTHVTRESFLKMPEKLGGDLWNQYKLCRIAFTKYPEAEKISYSIGTGLWVDLIIITKTGEKKEGRIFDGDKIR
jgi:hypothetical protein